MHLLALKPPRYAISPAAQVGSVWVPEVFQLVVNYQNPNYLNSLWLGTVWNLGVIPYRVFREFLVALFHFRFGVALLSIFVIPASALLIFVKGVLGKVRAHCVPLELVQQSVLLSKYESDTAFSRGHKEVVIDLDTIKL
jgi:hypothetical protein